MNVQPHDFRRPTPLAMEWRDRLTSWWQASATQATKEWAKQLPSPVDLTIDPIDLCFAGPILTRQPEDSLVYRIKLGDRLTSLLILKRTLMLNLAGTLLGDNGAATDRELTLIEEKLGEYFLMQHWLMSFRATWPAVQGVSWVLDGRERNLASSRLYAESEVLLVMNWKLKGVWGEGEGNWYFPKKGLTGLLSPTAASEVIPEAQLAIRRDAIVQKLPLHVEFILGSTEVKLSELSSLRVGDVVMLDQRATEGIQACSGGQAILRGLIGRVGAWKAFQVESSIKK